MCIAVSFVKNNTPTISCFSEKRIKLLLYNENDNSEVYEVWGRRKNEYSDFPFGGWITIESAKSKHWQNYSPALVKVIANKFLVKDLDNISAWFDVPEGQCIQGLSLIKNNQKRIYIVTSTRHVGDLVYLLWPTVTCL